MVGWGDGMKVGSDVVGCDDGPADVGSEEVGLCGEGVDDVG